VVHVRWYYVYAYTYYMYIIYLAATICRILYYYTICPSPSPCNNIMRRIYNMIMIIIILFVVFSHGFYMAIHRRVLYYIIVHKATFFVLLFCFISDHHEFKFIGITSYYQGTRRSYELKLKKITK